MKLIQFFSSALPLLGASVPLATLNNVSTGVDINVYVHGKIIPEPE
jgi:hypothetical protein